MRKSKETNLYKFLNSYSLTENAAEYFKDVLNFNIDNQLPQRKLVQLGRAIGRIVSMEMTLKLGDTGFNSSMISNSLKVLSSEIHALVSTFNNNEDPSVLDDYSDNSSWLKFVNA
jgi:hypothetical protein